MKTIIAIAALLFSLTIAENASAQFGIRVGRVAVSVPAVRSPYTGGVSRVNPYTRRPMPHLASPGVFVPVASAPIVVQPAAVDPFHGQWAVQASHVNASISISPGGYSMITGGVQELGGWRWNATGGNGFVLVLKSRVRGVSTFQGRWIVPGRQFQMTSTSSGLTYTVTRAGTLAPATPAVHNGIL